MITEYQVPFFGNTNDNTHCFQAVLKMIIKYFQPDHDYSWKELEKKTAKVEGLWTWTMAGALWLHDEGYDVRLIGTFDHERFTQEGEGYLAERFRVEIARRQVEKSDIAQERQLSRDYASKVVGDKRVPDIADIQQCVDDGYLVLCNVNSRTLNGELGFSGHFVVVIGYDENSLVLHDPGLPPRERRIISNDQFRVAWAYSGEHSKEILGFQYS